MTNPNFSIFNVGDELQIIVLVHCECEEAGAPQEGAEPQATLTYSGDRAGRQGNAGGPCSTWCVQTDAEHFTNDVQGSYTSWNKPKTSNAIPASME